MMEAGAQKKFFDYGVRLGLYVDTDDQKSVSRLIDKQLKDIRENTAKSLEGTIWGSKWTQGAANLTSFTRTWKSEQEGIKKLISEVSYAMTALALDPSNPEYKKIADGFSWFSKMLAKTGNTGSAALQMIGVSAEEAAVVVSTSMAAATLGITLLIDGVLMLGKGMLSLASVAMSSRDRMKEWDTILMGVGTDSLVKFNTNINQALSNVVNLGMGLERGKSVIKDFLKSGLSVSESVNGKLAQDVLMIADITGTASSDVANYYADMRKSINMTESTITDGITALMHYNNTLDQYAHLGAVSVNTYMQAIRSSKTDLALAARMGSSAVVSMQKDIIALSALSTRANMDVNQLISGFQEAGNVITNADSKYRSLLLISGGATIQNVLTGVFDKTNAMIKQYEYLDKLNKSLGGNLNLTAQIAQQTFGINKEQVVGLLSQNKETLLESVRLQKELNAFQEKNSGLQTRWKAFANTLGDTWEKLKNVVMSKFFQAIESPRLQGALDRLSTLAQKLMDNLNGPLGDSLTKIFEWVTDKMAGILDWLYDIIGGDELVKTLNDPNSALNMSIGDWISGIGERLGASILRGIVGALPGVGDLLDSALTGVMNAITFGQVGFETEAEKEAKRKKNPNYGRNSVEYQDSNGNVHDSQVYQWKSTGLSSNIAKSAIGDKELTTKEAIQALKSTQSDMLSALNDKMQRFSGMKDTDAVYTTNDATGRGEWTTVGQAREELERKRDAVQTEIRDVLVRIEALQKKESDKTPQQVQQMQPAQPVQQQRPNYQSAHSPSPAATRRN